MLSRPTTEQILLDCCRELTTNVLPALSDALTNVYQGCVEDQMRCYQQLIVALGPKVAEEFFRIFPARKKSPEKWALGLKKKAQEIARYVLPVATLTLTLLAHVARLTRSSMVEALESMYVKVARARGLPERVVIVRHALRHALIPSITVLAQDFGFLIGGIVAVETVFAYPGLGRMLVGALERQDLPLM